MQTINTSNEWLMCSYRFPTFSRFARGKNSSGTGISSSVGELKKHNLQLLLVETESSVLRNSPVKNFFSFFLIIKLWSKVESKILYKAPRAIWTFRTFLKLKCRNVCRFGALCAPDVWKWPSNMYCLFLSSGIMTMEGAASGFTPREYQTLIMEKAMKENIIIYLPTGAGKTYIASLLIKRMCGAIKK